MSAAEKRRGKARNHQLTKTRDYALYDPTLETATNGTIIPSISTDYPFLLTIGPSYFQSYHTWPNTKFIHGFNLAKNGSEAMESLLETATLACKALGDGKLEHWELGNEPDQYSTSAQKPTRPSSWDDKEYVREWLHKSAAIKKKMQESCSHGAEGKYIAPSFASISGNALNLVLTWRDGLNDHHNIAQDSAHKYVSFLLTYRAAANVESATWAAPPNQA